MSWSSTLKAKALLRLFPHRHRHKRQADKTVADEITQFAHKHNLRPFGRAGYEQGKWVLLDFVDVVIHIFDEEFRQYYDLELLWGDAEKLKI